MIVPSTGAPRAARFYGWVILPIASLCYGFGISPAYYSWGAYLPDVIAELGLSREEAGRVFGLFAFLTSAVGPVVGLIVARFGLRWVMALGSIVAGLGFVGVARASSLGDFYLSFAVLGGIGIGFSTLVPCQVLAANWFRRWRATALSIVLAAGGVVGMLSPRARALVLAHGTWRDGWLLIASVSVVLAVLAAAFVRDRPEDLGQQPDGAANGAGTGAKDTRTPSEDVRGGSLRAALLSWRYAAISFAAVGCIVPWVVVVTHGGLHLADRGLDAARAGGLLGTMALMSVPGRLLTSAADWIAPPRVLAAALAVETAGIVLLARGHGATAALGGVILLGLGFGAAYTAVSACLARFYRLELFPTVSGGRLLITALFSAVAPALVGRWADRAGNYDLAFVGLGALCAVSALVASRLRSHE